MITKMSKYDFILYAGACGDFVEKVRGLGLVDITTSSWEANDAERELVLSMEEYTKAIAELELLEAGSSAYSSGVEAFAAYAEAVRKRTEITGEVALLEKQSTELQVWGDFSPQTLENLRSQGVVLRFFTAQEADYNANIEAWSSENTVELISIVDGIAYFVVVSTENAVLQLDAQEVKQPEYTAQGAAEKCVKEQAALAELEGEFKRCAASLNLIKEELRTLKSQLELAKINGGATTAADGSLLVMEAWAEESTSAKVDALLEEYPNVVYFKSDPTPEDNTPVKLKNSLFPWTFELIGNMYALPKYGTMDFTPFFAPFYMLFFAICLGDAGYGMIILLAGLGMKLFAGESMRQASWLATFCGLAATIFGFSINSLFGANFSSLPVPFFQNFPYINFQTTFFNVSMMIGFVHVMLAMIINICLKTHLFGFKYALGLLGWFMVLVSSAAAFMLPDFGVAGFEFDSIAYYCVAGLGGVLMLFFNSPGKNIFVNFASGIWDTYNNLTGILGDILSYIRLFAIGLSGGVLGLVFNDLAFGMTGLDAGLEGNLVSIIGKILGATAILLIGHGINIFMSTISAFVHPMRLTFVEFFKNGGFEAATRSFEPLNND